MFYIYSSALPARAHPKLKGGISPSAANDHIGTPVQRVIFAILRPDDITMTITDIKLPTS